MDFAQNVVDRRMFTRAVQFFVFAAAITIVATIVTYIINPDLKTAVEGLKKSTSSEIHPATGLDKIWSYFRHNGLAVPFQMFILALIPIPFLYLLNVVSTSALLGVAFGIALQVDLDQGVKLILSSIPHSIVEIFAYTVLAAALFEMNRAWRMKIKKLFKKDSVQEQQSLVQGILKTVKIDVVFVIPLIVVAAFLETYLADLIFHGVS
jgi:uncharacterized membrane protein SpoIIM required for sporulation